MESKQYHRLRSARIGLSVLVVLACFTVIIGSSWSGTVDYTYDGAGRLVRARYENGTTIEYTYDAAGNLLSREITAGGGDSALKVLTATIKQNKKTVGQKAKIVCTFQMASDKDLTQGLVVTVGEHTQTLNPPDLIEKGTSWQYKRPKGQPKQGVKKLKIKWNKKGNVNRDAVKVTIAIDDARIFAGAIPGGALVNVDISLQNGTNRGAETTPMEQKKAGKLKYKAPKK